MNLPPLRQPSAVIKAEALADLNVPHPTTGEPRQIKAGETVDVSRDDLGPGLRIVGKPGPAGTVIPRGKSLADLRVKVDADTLPPELADAPRELRLAWPLLSQREAAVQTIRAAREHYLGNRKGAGVWGPPPAGASEDELTKFQLVRQAEDELREWELRYGLDLLRVMFAASTAVLHRCESARRLALEIQSTAFEIFRARLEPLGLAEDKIRQLFRGSAAFVKYSAANDNISHAGLASECDPRVGAILGLPLATMASECRRFDSIRAKLETLKAAADAELAAVKRAVEKGRN